MAPEAASDAKDGGALVPTLALGIPGGTGTAMLLGALTLHGLSPGRELLTDHLVLVFVLIWSLFLSSWITSLLGVSLVNPMARLSTIRTSRLVPVILALAMIGAIQYRGMVADAVCAVAFGFVGFLMNASNKAQGRFTPDAPPPLASLTTKMASRMRPRRTR